jgi:hypothetical protein
MRMPGSRRSDRVNLSVRLLVSGNDKFGSVFAEECNTVVISRRGARIAIPKPIKPLEEIHVRVIASGLEADMQVIGVIAESNDGIHYGVRITDPKVELWQIDFPSTMNSEDPTAKVLLECEVCQYTAVVYLREFEVEVFESQKELSLHCKKCNAATTWRLSHREPSPPFAPAPVPTVAEAEKSPAKPAGDGSERRVHRRLGLKLTACIRTATFGDDVVPTENVSKGGFSFKSANKYAVGLGVEVAVPYSPGAGNIFSLAKITGFRALPEKGAYAYGVCYLRDKDLRP